MPVILLLLLLLVAPAWALGGRIAEHVDPWAVGAVPLALSLLCYAAQRSDKRRAQLGARRIPETWLHLGELLGGWPGSLVGQRRHRHKVGKVSYQTIFWLIVLTHQLIAIESLRGWPWSQQVLVWGRSQLS